MKKINNKSLVPLAQKLRKNMTREECHIWYDFLKNHPIKFTRQKIIGYYIVDFYAPALKLVIEIDGGHHFTEQGILFDTKRAEFFQKRNIVVLRITNDSIHNCFEKTCIKIDDFIQDRLSQMK